MGGSQDILRSGRRGETPFTQSFFPKAPKLRRPSFRANSIPVISRNGSGSKLNDRLAQLADFIRKNLGTWSPKEREVVVEKLSALAREIEELQ
jgi:hypothetical protein